MHQLHNVGCDRLAYLEASLMRRFTAVSSGVSCPYLFDRLIISCK